MGLGLFKELTTRALAAVQPGRHGPARFFRGNLGYCSICARQSGFVSRHSWLRDHYRCVRCGSIPRERALMLVLERRFPEWRTLAVHESSPGLPSSKKLERECPRYCPTFFFPAAPPGALHRGFRSENLERQTFSAGTFDLVVTQDVMEHVLDPEAAFRDIARTLRPRGAHVFTTPIYRGQRESEVRARRCGDEITHLAEPEYHGDPINPDGALVTMHYGEDIGDLIVAASGMSTTIYWISDPKLGLAGEFLDVLVSVKPG